MRLPDAHQSRPVFILVGGYFLLICIIISASTYVWHDNMMNVAGPHQDDVLWSLLRLVADIIPFAMF